MATFFSKMGVLGLFLIFIAISGTSTWARQLDNEEGVTKTVSIATTSANKGGANEVLRWVTTIYTPKPNPWIECGKDNIPCTTGLGFYDTCCTDQGYYCYEIAATAGICRKR